MCVVSFVFVGPEVLLVCGLLAGRCTCFSVLYGLFGMGSLWLACCCFSVCHMLLPFVAMPGLCCFLCATRISCRHV